MTDVGNWWECGSQANAAANACAANQGAQAAALSQAGSLMAVVPKDPTFGAKTHRVETGLTGQAQVDVLCLEASVHIREKHDAFKRIAELEAENAKLRDVIAGEQGRADGLAKRILKGEAELLESARQRANKLADGCGRLRDENTQLLVENARLRRAKK